MSGTRPDRHWASGCAIKLDGLDLGGDLLRHILRELGVAEVLGHVLAVTLAPVDELDDLFGEALVLQVTQILVDEEVGEAADRVGVVARGIHDGDLEAGGEDLEGGGGGGIDALDGGANVLASLVNLGGIGEFFAGGIGELDVTDGADGAFDRGGDAGVALAADSDGPLDGGGVADVVSPRLRDLAEVIGEDEGGAGAIGAMDDDDGPGGEVDAGIEGLDLGIVPLLDVAEVDAGDDGDHQTPGSP